jgi:hypothetical protein
VGFFRDRAWYIVGGLLLFVGCVFDLRRRVLNPEWQPRMGGFVMALCVGFGAIFVVQWDDRSSTQTLSATRNFYGTLKVFNYYPDDPEDNYHLLLHGATTHGIQFVKPEKAVMATTYYADSSGVGRAISSLPETPRRLGWSASAPARSRSTDARKTTFGFTRSIPPSSNSRARSSSTSITAWPNGM